MFKYILKRILVAIPLLIVISIISFALIQLAPYDAVDSLAQPGTSVDQLNAIKEAYHLNDPVYVQYFYWIKEVLVGNFGYSIQTGESIAQTLSDRVPNTFMLVLPVFIVSFFFATILGLLSGANKGKLIDKIIESYASFAISMPTFLSGILFLYFFSLKLNIFPSGGIYTIGQEHTFGAYLQHLILPGITLVIAITPDMIRYIRSSTISQLSEDYVMVQKAYGSSKIKVIINHVFKNILIPVVTLFGLLLPMLVTGSFVTESIFSWPGVGPYFLTAINSFDYPVIMTILLLSSIFVILGNLISDVLYGVIDPRVRETQKNE